MNPVTSLPVQKEKYRFAGTAALSLLSEEENSVSVSIAWSVNLKAGVAGLPDTPLTLVLPEEELSFLEPERSYPVFAHCVGGQSGVAEVHLHSHPGKHLSRPL